MRIAGLVVSGDKIIIVDAESDGDEVIEIVADLTWSLQRGDRSEALGIAYQQIQNYLREHEVKLALVKASALTRGGARLSNLHSAELRGVVIAAAASVCEVRTPAKAQLSKAYGNRKVDEYLSDNEFWEERISGHKLRNGSREAAFLILADER